MFKTRTCPPFEPFSSRIISFNDQLLFSEMCRYISQWRSFPSPLIRHCLQSPLLLYRCMHFSIKSNGLEKNWAIGKLCYCVWRSTMYWIEINSFQCCCHCSTVSIYACICRAHVRMWMCVYTWINKNKQFIYVLHAQCTFHAMQISFLAISQLQTTINVALKRCKGIEMNVAQSCHGYGEPQQHQHHT